MSPPARPDVVVVGAGSAGAVLAARLSGDPRRTVLLLEAGPDHRAADTPASLAGPHFTAAVREPGRTWPSLHAVRAAGQSSRPYLRGRGVGGSSAVNAMVLLPAHPLDHDAWAADGCVGWSWAEVAPWYERTAVVGRRTPPGELGAVDLALLRAHPAAEVAQLSRDGSGRRHSVNDAYLEPVRHRPNLVVRGVALVDRVLLEGRRAVGVRLADGTEIEAGAVVLAAGAVHSPAILLRSGVEREGIGRGLQDHPSFAVTLRLRDDVAVPDVAPDVGALLRASYCEPDDLQVLSMNTAGPDAPRLGVLLGALMVVRSTGSVRLASHDPTVDPVVDFAMLSDERDLEGLRAAVALVERLVATEPVQRIAEVLPYDASDAGLRAGVGDYVHAVGTCRMGDPAHPGTVVDPTGAVVGYEGLAVCDASVFPSAPRANTHLPTVVLAERMAALMTGLTTGRTAGGDGASC